MRTNRLLLVAGLLLPTTAVAQTPTEFGVRFQPQNFRPINFQGFSFPPPTFAPRFGSSLQFEPITFPSLTSASVRREFVDRARTSVPRDDFGFSPQPSSFGAYSSSATIPQRAPDPIRYDDGRDVRTLVANLGAGGDSRRFTSTGRLVASDPPAHRVPAGSRLALLREGTEVRRTAAAPPVRRLATATSRTAMLERPTEAGLPRALAPTRTAALDISRR